MFILPACAPAASAPWHGNSFANEFTSLDMCTSPALLFSACVDCFFQHPDCMRLHRSCLLCKAVCRLMPSPCPSCTAASRSDRYHQRLICTLHGQRHIASLRLMHSDTSLLFVCCTATSRLQVLHVTSSELCIYSYMLWLKNIYSCLIMHGHRMLNNWSAENEKDAAEEQAATTFRQSFAHECRLMMQTWMG